MISYTEIDLKPAKLITLKTHVDPRGWFTETYRETWNESIIKDNKFIFEFTTFSKVKGTLRGLHCQNSLMAQSKLVTVFAGKIFDVIVDARKDSPTFGQYQSFILSADAPQILYVPKGFFHGFITMEDNTIVNYKLDNYHLAESETGIVYNDSFLNIEWPVPVSVISERDKKHPTWENCFKFEGFL